MAMKSMLSDPCAQPSFRTSMPLCFKYERIASCDLSSMLFPWLSASSCWGPPSWRALWCGWRLRESGSARGKSETRMRPSFPRGALCLSEKFSRPLRASDRGRFAPKARRGKGVCGGFPWECGDETTARCCAPRILSRRLMEIWWADWLLTASLGSGVPA